MTLIAGLGFLDESYLISDSRITYSKQSQIEDRLIKIYQIAPKMMIAFASEHVDFTLEVLKRITSFSLENLNSKKGRFILPHLVRLANFEYQKLLKETGITKPPKMEFLYCGVINKSQMFSSYLLHEIIKKKGGSFQVPEKIGRAMMKNAEGIWSLDPPCPILYKQFLPNDPPHPYIYLGYVTGGSGQEIFYEIEKEYYKLFDWDLGMTKGIILENIVDDYIRKNKITTVGGIVQVWRINKDGIRPICYVQKQNNANGEEKVLKELKFTDKKWVMVNYINREKSEASSMVSYFSPKVKQKVKKISRSNY